MNYFLKTTANISCVMICFVSSAFAVGKNKSSGYGSVEAQITPANSSGLDKKTQEALKAWDKYSKQAIASESLTDKKYNNIIVGETSGKNGIFITDLRPNDYMYDRAYHELRQLCLSLPRSLAVVTLEFPQGNKKSVSKFAPLYFFSAAPRKFTEDHFFTNIDWLKNNRVISQNVRVSFVEKLDGEVGRVFFFNHNGKLFMCVGSKKATSQPYDFGDKETFINQAKYTKKATDIRTLLKRQSLNSHDPRKPTFQAVKILLDFFETLSSEKREILLDRLMSKETLKNGDILNTLIFETTSPGVENFISIEKYGFSKDKGMLSFLNIIGNASLPALTQDSLESTFSFFDQCGLPHPQILGVIDLPISFFSPQIKEVEGIRKKVMIEVATCTYPAYREAMALNFYRLDSEGVIAFVSLPDGCIVSMKKEKTADYRMMRFIEKCALDVINGKINFNNSVASVVASKVDAINRIREFSTKLSEEFKELVQGTTLEGRKFEINTVYWEGLCKFLIDTLNSKAEGRGPLVISKQKMHEFINFVQLRKTYDTTIAKCNSIVP